MSVGTSEERTPALPAESASGRTVTDARLDRLREYVNECQSIMGLAEWHTKLKLDRRPTIDEAAAEVSVTKNRLEASLMFAEDFFLSEPAEQRHIVAHELSHLVTNQLLDVIFEGGLKEVIGRPALALLAGAAQQAEEQAVDRFASMIEGLLPLPDLDRVAPEPERPPE